ncbi:MAG: hypothetical protein MJH10_17110 [Epibacterium sp.]|nr:hypothetical protein [Epibacterium sp.]NQX75230.1 hypothetical protein [Epibacterium sp.]
MVTIDQVATASGVTYGVAAKWLREPFAIRAILGPASQKGGYRKLFMLADVVPRIRDHLARRGTPHHQITNIVHKIIQESLK